jgi:Rrf2 family protein
MQITRAAEYGVLGLVALARRPAGEVVMIDVICDEEDVPRSFLGKIFQSLTRAGIVRSARGSGGGFTLARLPGKISALEIIEAVEGPIALQRCLDDATGCEHSGGCALCGLFAEAQDRVREVFAATSLADLAGRHIPNGNIRRAQDRSRETSSQDPKGPELMHLSASQDTALHDNAGLLHATTDTMSTMTTRP